MFSKKYLYGKYVWIIKFLIIILKAFTFLNRDDYILFNRILVDSKEGCGRELRLHTTEFSNTSAPSLDMQKQPCTSSQVINNDFLFFLMIIA